MREIQQTTIGNVTWYASALRPHNMNKPFWAEYKIQRVEVHDNISVWNTDVSVMFFENVTQFSMAKNIISARWEQLK